MAQVEYQHLSPLDVDVINDIASIGLITSSDLPRGISIGLDSMGPVRNSKTDALFSGMRETLFRFRKTLERHELTLVVATNGPDIEGLDILEAIDPNHTAPIRAFAVTEGGARVISRTIDGLGWDYTTLADEKELEGINNIAEEASANSQLMAAFLQDKKTDGKDAPIRTPYHTNIVLTFPNSLDTLRDRLIAREIDLEREMPGVNQQNYLDKMLNFADDQFLNAIILSGLEKSVKQVTKKQNRRHYVMPAHLVDGLELDKSAGATLGSGIVGRELHRLGVSGYREFNIGNSVYIADKAVDLTGEGQTVIGSSERSMIRGFTYFVGTIPEGVNVAREYRELPGVDGNNFHLVDVNTRLAINVTMDNALPRITEVEGVKVLHLGSGGKALEALELLYNKIHR